MPNRYYQIYVAAGAAVGGSEDADADADADFDDDDAVAAVAVAGTYFWKLHQL